MVRETSSGGFVCGLRRVFARDVFAVSCENAMMSWFPFARAMLTETAKVVAQSQKMFDCMFWRSESSFR